MSPRDRPRPGGTKPAPRPRSAAHRPRPGLRRRLALGAGLVAIAVLAPMAARWGRPRPAPDPLASLTALAAADSADRRIRDGRHLESLDYIARIERLAGAGDADFEARAATAAGNATSQVRARDGLVIPVTRSSVERAGLMRDAWLRLERAEGKVVHPAQHRNIVVVRAGQLAVWGFVREGYAEYRRAHEIHPLDPRALGEAGWLERALREPARADPGAGT